MISKDFLEYGKKTKEYGGETKKSKIKKLTYKNTPMIYPLADPIIHTFFETKKQFTIHLPKKFIREIGWKKKDSIQIEKFGNNAVILTNLTKYGITKEYARCYLVNNEDVTKIEKQELDELINRIQKGKKFKNQKKQIDDYLNQTGRLEDLKVLLSVLENCYAKRCRLVINYTKELIAEKQTNESKPREHKMQHDAIISLANKQQVPSLYDKESQKKRLSAEIENLSNYKEKIDKEYKQFHSLIIKSPKAAAKRVDKRRVKQIKEITNKIRFLRGQLKI